MSDNLNIQAQLNKLLEEARGILEKQTAQYQSQAAILANIVRAQAAMGSTIPEERLGAMAEALEKANVAATAYAENETGITNMTRAMKAGKEEAGFFGETFEKVRKGINKLSWRTEALLGFANGLAFVGQSARTLVSFAGGVAKVIGHIAASLIMFPFKLLQGLINAADSSGGTELQQALEDIRKEFGYLNKTAGGAITGMARSMQGQLANTGLSVYRIFGTLAQRLQYVAEYAKALGPVFDSIGTSLGEGGVEALGAYNKALGFSAEAQKGIATRAVAAGTTINETNRQIANYSLQLSQRFGLTMKEVSRAVGDMMADFEHFGHLAPKELTQVAVYARKLGIEVKALAGIMDKSFNFEDAATQAAQLSQAFGLNIDAMEQMKEQDPGKKLDNLRKAFFAAGRSIEGMTAQERRLLSQQTGLDANALDLTFSLKNQALSYGEIQKKGDAAKKSQISQAEAMHKLAGAIERLVQQGNMGSGGFFDRFFQGFELGMRRTREWRHLMMNMRRALRSTYRAGIQVGRSFVHMFPGVRDVFGAIAQIFNPTRFRAMMNGVVRTFREFFAHMTTDPRTALPMLFAKLKKGFMDNFSKSTPAGARLLEGFRKFFTAFAFIGNSLLKIAITGITDGVKYIIDLLTGARRLPSAASAAGAAAGPGSLIGKLFGTLSEGLAPMFIRLWGKIQQAGSLIWDRVWPWIRSHLAEGFAALFGPSIAMMITRGVATALITGLVNGAAKALADRAATAALNRVAGRVTQGANPAATIPDVTGPLAAVRAANDEAAKLRPSRDLIYKLGFVAGVIGLGFIAIWGALKLIRGYQIKREEIINAGLLLVSMVPVFIGASLAVKAASLIPSSNLGALAASLGIIGLTVVGMAGISWLIIEAVKHSSFSRSDVTNTAMLIGAMAELFLVASGIVVVATAIGAVLGTGFGFAAFSLGIATITGVVIAMSAQSMLLLQSLDRFHPGPGLKEKTELFVSIVRTIGVFSRDIASILTAVRPGILATVASILTFGSSDPQEAMKNTIGKVKEIIEAIGTQMMALILTIQNATRTMTPEQVERGRALGELLGAVGTLATSLRPPPALMDTNWFELLTSVPDKLKAFTALLKATKDNVVEIGNQVISLTRDLNAVSVDPTRTRQAAETLKLLFESFGTLAQNIMPTPALMSELNRSTNINFSMTTVTQFITGFMNTIANTSIFTKIGEFITTIKNAIANIPTENTAKFTAFGSIIGETMKSISGISTLIGGLLPTILENTRLTHPRTIAQTSDRISQMTHPIAEFIDSMFRSVTTFLPALLTGLNTITLTPADITNMKAKLGVLNTIFEFLGRIPATVQSYATLRIGNGTNTRQINPRTMFRMLGEIIDALVHSNIGEKIRPLGTLNLPRGISEKMTALKGVMDALSSITSVLSGLNAPEQAGNISQDLASFIATRLASVARIITTITNPQGWFGFANPFLRGANNIGTKFANISVPSNVAGKITSITTATTNIGNAATELNNFNPTIDSAAIATKLGAIASVTTAITGHELFNSTSPGYIGTKFNHINVPRHITGKITRMTELFNGIQTAMAGLNPGNSTSLVGITASVQDVDLTLAGLIRIDANIEHVLERMNTKTRANVGTVIRGMVANINDIGAELREIRPVNIDARLRDIGQHLGLGDRSTFNINQGRVNVTVNAEIKIMASELEEMLLMRKGSRILHT